MMYSFNPLTSPVAQLFLHATMVDYGCPDVLKKEQDYRPAERESNLIVICIYSVSDQVKIQVKKITILDNVSLEQIKILG